MVRQPTVIMQVLNVQCVTVAVTNLSAIKTRCVIIQAARHKNVSSLTNFNYLTQLLPKGEEECNFCEKTDSLALNIHYWFGLCYCFKTF